MSSSTIDYAPQDIGSTTTPPEVLRTAYVVDDVVVRTMRAAEEVASITQAISTNPEPDAGARERLRRQLFDATGWEVFQSPEDAERETAERAGYAEIAAEYQAEDAERRRIARRRPPAED